jgi:hypothetical protein
MAITAPSTAVMPGLGPGIHPLAKGMDCRVMPGNDNCEIATPIL